MSFSKYSLTFFSRTSVGTSSNDTILIFSAIKFKVKHLVLQLLYLTFLKPENLHEMSTLTFLNLPLNSGCLGQGTT